VITRGSKFFFGAAAVAYLCALVYGFLTGAAQHGGVFAVFSDGNVVNSVVGPISFGWKGWVGEHIGYSVLMGAAAAFLGLGGFATAFRDGDAEATAAISGTTNAPPVLRPEGLSYWPVVAAVGAGTAMVGLAVDPVYFVVGLVILAVAGFSWTVRAWAERTSGDRDANREYRNQLMDPLEIPVVSALVAVIVVLAVSRLLLAIPKLSATLVIIIVAAVIFSVAMFLAQRPQLKRSVVVGIVVVGSLALLGAGIAGGIAGQREFEKHGSEESGAPAPDDSVAAVAGVLNGATWLASGS
jgi:uncharacterized membrane-anchored protein